MIGTLGLDSAFTFAVGDVDLIGRGCSFVDLGIVDSSILGIDVAETAASCGVVFAAFSLSVVDTVFVAPFVSPIASFEVPSILSAEPGVFKRIFTSSRILDSEVEALATAPADEVSEDWALVRGGVSTGLLEAVVGCVDEECADDVADLLVGFFLSFNISNFCTSSNTEVFGFCGRLDFTSSTFAVFFADDGFFAVIAALVAFRVAVLVGVSSISTSTSVKTFLGRPLFLTAISADMMDDVFSRNHFTNFLCG